MNTKDILPVDEYDISKIEKLEKLRNKDFRKIVPDLFRWTENSDYPIYPFITDFLAYRQADITDEIRKVFRTNNIEWQKNLLNDLLIRLNSVNINKLKSVIEKARVGILKEEADRCYEYCFERKPLIRPACKYDCDSLAHAKLTVWQETFSHIYPEARIRNYDTATQSAYFLNIINDPNESLYILQMDSECVGYMCCGAPFRPFRNYAQCINLLNLTDVIKGKGYGRKLFELAESIISFRGYNEFFLMCNKYNYPAQQFYVHMGGVFLEADDDNEDGSVPQIKYHFNIEKKGTMK